MIEMTSNYLLYHFVDQRLPLPLPECFVAPRSLVHHGELLSGDVQTQTETVEVAEQ